MSQYIFGAMYPKLAVKKGFDIRLPSTLPIPTACIRIARTYSITTGSAGQVCINYCPGSLLRSNDGAGG